MTVKGFRRTAQGCCLSLNFGDYSQEGTAIQDSAAERGCRHVSSLCKGDPSLWDAKAEYGGGKTSNRHVECRRLPESPVGRLLH